MSNATTWSVANAGVAALQQDEVLHHQAGADEQHEGEGDLRDHQAVAERCRRRWWCADRLRARPMRARAPQPDERPEAAHDADRHRHGGGERQDASVDLNRRRARQLSAGQRDEGPHGPAGPAGGPARRRPPRARALARAAARGPLAGAQREPDGQLAPAGHAGREQQVRRRSRTRSAGRAAPRPISTCSEPRTTADDLPIRPDVHAVVVAELARQRLSQRAHLGSLARSGVTPSFRRA